MDEKDDIKLIGYKEVDELYLRRKTKIKIISTIAIVLCIIGTICGIFLWQNFCN